MGTYSHRKIHRTIMANIIFNVEEFQCVSPIIGDTFRHNNEYRFNWTSNWDDYVALGLNAQIRLFSSGDGQPYQEYTNQPIPANANQFLIDDLPGFDTSNFRVIFDIDGGDTCSYTFDIPYSSIIIN